MYVWGVIIAGQISADTVHLLRHPGSSSLGFLIDLIDSLLHEYINLIHQSTLLTLPPSDGKGVGTGTFNDPSGYLKKIQV